MITGKQFSLISLSLLAAVVASVYVLKEEKSFSGLSQQEQRLLDFNVNRSPAQFDLVSDSFNLFVTGIYRSTAELGKLPVKIATPFVLKSKVRNFLKNLPVEKNVKDRILRRIDSKQFIDSVVPFLLALKDQYSPTETFEIQTFEDHLVQSYKVLPTNVPGFEHKLFKWPTSQMESTSQIPFQLDPKVLAKLVEYYDLLFIQDGVENLYSGNPIKKSTIKLATAKVNELLIEVMKIMDPKSENYAALNFMISDQKKTEALTISLSHFLRSTVHDNYHRFAKKVLQTHDLKKWMHSEFKKKNGGKLFDFTKAYRHNRRFAVQTVVDGLQGHLLEALTSANQPHPFLQQIHKDKEDFVENIPDGIKFTKAPDQNLEYLNFIYQTPIHDSLYLPFFKDLYQNHKSSIAQVGLASTPTISVRNLPIAKTGAGVTGFGSTNIPNFHFVDRIKDRAFYFFGNDALLLDELVQENQMKTMFERMPQLISMNCNAQYTQGSGYLLDPFINLAAGEKIRDFSDRLCLIELRRRLTVEKNLQKYADEILSKEDTWPNWSINPSRHRLSQLVDMFASEFLDGLPDYLLYYNPWPDHFAHFTGPFSDEILAPSGELARLDYWLKQITQVYKEAQYLNRTLFGMAGDHGLTPVYVMLNPEEAVFEAIKKEGIDLVVEKISSDEGEGPKITHPWEPPSMKNIDLVIASTAGGNYMIDAFLSQNPQEWQRQPLFSDLKKWQTLKGVSIDLLEEIRVRLGETLDYMVVRLDHTTTEKSSTKLIATRQGGLAQAHVFRFKNRYFYESEQDLLDVKKQGRYMGEKLNPRIHEHLLNRCITQAKREDTNTWCNRREWMIFTSYTDRPDSVVQIAHLYDSERAGTINLFPAVGVGYNTTVPGRHAGEHFHEKDAFVGFWGEPVQQSSKNSRLISVENGSLAPTIYQYLMQVPDQEIQQNNGWGYPSILSEISNQSPE